MFRLDLHVHTGFSDDGQGSPKEVVSTLKSRGLDGVAITDHNTLEGALKAKKFGSRDFVVLTGVEISSSDGHVLALDVDSLPAVGVSVEETVESILDLGGFPIIPHVFRNMSGVYRDGLERVNSKCFCMEVFNAASMPQSNLKMMRLADELGLGGTGGSDAHMPQYAGLGYTEVDCDVLSVDEVLEQMRKKRSWGRGVSLPFEYRQQRFLSAIRRYFGSGVKKI